MFFIKLIKNFQQYYKASIFPCSVLEDPGTSLSLFKQWWISVAFYLYSFENSFFFRPPCLYCWLNYPDWLREEHSCVFEKGLTDHVWSLNLSGCHPRACCKGHWAHSQALQLFQVQGGCSAWHFFLPLHHTWTVALPSSCAV